MHTRRHARPIGLLIRRKKELTLTADTVRERFSLPLIEMVAGVEVSSLFTLITGYHQILVNQWDVYKDSIRYTLWSIRLARDALRFHQRARDIPTFVARHCPFCVKSVCGHLLRRSLVSFRKRLKSIKNIYAWQSAIFFIFFSFTELHSLGHVLSPVGIRQNPDKVKAVTTWSNVATKKQAQSFLGLTGFYRRFIPDYASFTSCTHDFIAGKEPWSSKHDAIVSKLKEKLTSAPILILPNPANVFVVYTDASATYMGAVLHQVDPNSNQLLGGVAYEFKKFNKGELNYPVKKKKEFYAIILRTPKVATLPLRYAFHSLHGSPVIKVPLYPTNTHWTPRSLARILRRVRYGFYAILKVNRMGWRIGFVGEILVRI